MKKIIVPLMISLVLVISGCYNDSGTSSKQASGAFHSDVNLNANFYETGDDSLFISNRSAKVGQIVLIKDGMSTKAKRIESLVDGNAVVSNAKIEEVFTDLAFKDKYPLIEAQRITKAPAGSRASVNILSKIETIKTDSGIIFKLADYPVLDKKGFIMTVGGQVFIEKPEIDVDFNLFQKKVKVSAHFGESSEIHLNVDTPGLAFFHEKELLLGHYVAPVELYGFPICQISYALILKIGVFGEMNVYARVEQTLAADVTLDVTKNSFLPTYDFYPPTGEYYSYFVQGRGEFEAWVNLMPQVALQILQWQVASLDGDLGTSAKADLNVIASSNSNKGTFELDCEIHAFLQATLLEDKELNYELLNWSKEFTYEVDFLE